MWLGATELDIAIITESSIRWDCINTSACDPRLNDIWGSLVALIPTSLWGNPTNRDCSYCTNVPFKRSLLLDLLPETEMISKDTFLNQEHKWLPPRARGTGVDLSSAGQVGAGSWKWATPSLPAAQISPAASKPEQPFPCPFPS